MTLMRTEGRRPKNRPQAAVRKKRQVLKAVANAPQAQERVALRLLRRLLRALVSAEVERADRQGPMRLSRASIARWLVRLEELLLGRLGRAREVEEFRPVQPHPVAPVRQDRLR